MATPDHRRIGQPDPTPDNGLFYRTLSRRRLRQPDGRKVEKEKRQAFAQLSGGGEPTPYFLAILRHLGSSVLFAERVLRFRLWRLTRQQRALQRDGFPVYKPPFWKRRAIRKELGVPDYEEFPTLVDPKVLGKTAAERLKGSGVLQSRKRRLESRYWENTAMKYRVPVPDIDPDGADNKFWKLGPDEEGFTLTVEGIDHVRSKIRKEVKDRRDLIAGYIGPLTGLIGALTGLLVVAKAFLQ